MTVKLRFRLVVLVVLGVCAGACAAEQESCVFNPEAAPKPNWGSDKPGYLSVTEIARGAKLYQSMTSHGIVFLRTWSCEHFGVTANLIIATPAVGSSRMAAEFQWLASVALSSEKVSTIVDAVKRYSEELKDGTEVSIPASGYDLFSISFDVVGELTILTIRIQQS
jgi:hypothetical protein